MRVGETSGSGLATNLVYFFHVVGVSMNATVAAFVISAGEWRISGMSPGEG